METFASAVIALREKWVELPGGPVDSERRFSTDLLQLGDADLLTYWDEQASGAQKTRSWYHHLYTEAFRGKRVLEIGSGMGFDAIHFAGAGVEWWCSDIAADNLRMVKRVADAKELPVAGYLEIHSPAAFDALPGMFDIIWANGSLLHIPFPLAVEECQAIMRRLKRDGRWIELAYPYERWVREGARPFSEWGSSTDGERTPWVEWYDLEKLKLRLRPEIMDPVLNFSFGSSAFIWFDLARTGRTLESLWPGVELPPPPSITTPPVLWNMAETINLAPALEGAPEQIAADIECTVHAGSVGIGFLNTEQSRFSGPEGFADARGMSQRLTITGDRAGADLLAIRNAFGGGPSQVTISSIRLRPAL